MDVFAQRVLVVGLLVILYLAIAAWLHINGKNDFVYAMFFLPVVFLFWLIGASL